MTCSFERDPLRPAEGARRSTPRSRLGATLAVAAAVSVVTAFFAPALRPSLEIAHRDMGRLHLPTKQWLAAQLSEGRLPEWMPHAGVGAPVLGNSILATLHPFNLLLVLLPTPEALKAWVVLSVILAATGALAWARALGRSDVAASLTGIAFGLSGPIVSSTDNVTFLTTYAALPWIFAAAHVWLTQGGARRLALVGAASALCAAGGDPQAWGLALVLLPGYGAAVAAAGGRARGAARGALASLAGVVASAPVIFPVVAWGLESFRAGSLPEADLRRWNLHPARLAEAIVPGLFAGDGSDSTSLSFMCIGNRWTVQPWFASVYLGAAALALASVGARRDRFARWLVIAGAAFAWAALGPYAGFSQLAGFVPVLGAFRYQEKLFVWPALAVAVAAGAGSDALLSRDDLRRRLRLFAVVGAAMLAAGAVIVVVPGIFAPGTPAGPPGGHPLPREAWLELGRNAARGASAAGIALALLAVLLTAAARDRLGRAAPFAVAAVAVADLAAWNSGAWFLFERDPEGKPPLAVALASRNPTGIVALGGERDARWPERGRTENLRAWGRRTLLHPWNLPAGVRASEQYLALRDRRWEALGNAVRGREAALALFGFDHVIVADEPGNAVRAGLRPPWRVVAVDPELPAFAVLLPARPRAYVAARVASVDPASAFHFAALGGVADLTVVEGSPAPPAGAPAAGTARVVVDLPDEVEVAVSVDAVEDALLVLNDLFAPGWTASIDGFPATVIRANYAVRGVWVPPGTHRVQFEYRAPGLVAGSCVAFAGALALVLSRFIRRPRRARGAPMGPDEAPGTPCVGEDRP